MNTLVKTPQCNKSGTETDLTLSERSNRSFTCGECGERFVVEKDSPKTVIPKHTISLRLHDLRKRMDRESGVGGRAAGNDEHLQIGNANLATKQ